MSLAFGALIEEHLKVVHLQQGLAEQKKQLYFLPRLQAPVLGGCQGAGSKLC
jgi:hypothetical protein